jgi:transposase
MGSRATAPASPSDQARQTRPAARRRPRLPDRYRLRPAERNPLGDAAPGDGLRLRHDLLAPAAVLAAPGRMEETPARPPATGRAGEGDRLGKVLRGQPNLPRRFWGVLTGKNPTDRGKKGTKRHLLVDGKGTPLAVRITAANRNESLEAMNLVDDIPPIRGRRGRPRQKPKALYGDRAYGTPRNREGLKKRRIENHLARPRTPHGSGLGKIRYVVERSLAWVGQARRLKIRYDKLPSIHRAFHLLQLARICCTILQRDFC